MTGSDGRRQRVVAVGVPPDELTAVLDHPEFELVAVLPDGTDPDDLQLERHDWMVTASDAPGGGLRWQPATKGLVGQAAGPEGPLPSPRLRQEPRAAPVGVTGDLPADKVPSPQRGVLRGVVPVFSPKGGVGKTFTAVNLGAGLSRSGGLKVVLLDLDLHGGDVRRWLGLDATPSIIDVLPALEDGRRVDEGLQVHDSGLAVMTAPPRPEMAALVTERQIERLLQALARRHDLVLVDTPPDSNNPWIYHTLAAARRLVLVTSGDSACVERLQQFLALLERVFPELVEEPVLLLNRRRAAGPGQRNVEQHLSLRVTGVIPFDPDEVIRARRQGRSVLVRGDGSAAAQALQRLLQQIQPAVRRADPPLWEQRLYRLWENLTTWITTLGS